MNELNVTAVFGRMKKYQRVPLGPQGQKNENEDMRVTLNDAEITVPYRGQVANPELPSGKILDVIPVNGVLIFDALTSTPGAPPLKLADKALALEAVARNVQDGILPCPVKFFEGNDEITTERAMAIALEVKNGGRNATHGRDGLAVSRLDEVPQRSQPGQPASAPEQGGPEANQPSD